MFFCLFYMRFNKSRKTIIWKNDELNDTKYFKIGLALALRNHIETKNIHKFRLAILTAYSLIANIYYN